MAPRRFTIEQVEKALRKSQGLQTGAAKILGVTCQAISSRIKKSEYLQKVQNEIVENMLDASENVVHHHIVKEKNLTAAFFYLKTKGKHRGYVEKQQTEFSGEININRIERIIVDVEEAEIEETKAIEHTTD